MAMDRQGEHASQSGLRWGEDEESFRRLFERHYPAVCQFFANRGMSAEESLDLAQETFLRAFRGIGGLQPDVSTKAWLFMIASNVWRNELRHRAAAKRHGSEVPLGRWLDAEEATQQDERELLGTAFPATGPEALAEVLEREREEFLRQAISELPPRMRRCVILRLNQGLKYREIASVLQISIAAVKSHLSQASGRLKASLSSHFSDIEFP